MWGVIPGVGWSDHGAFWKEGFPAVMVTDTALFRYPAYHSNADRPRFRSVRTNGARRLRPARCHRRVGECAKVITDESLPTFRTVPSSSKLARFLSPPLHQNVTQKGRTG